MTRQSRVSPAIASLHSPGIVTMYPDTRHDTKHINGHEDSSCLVLLQQSLLCYVMKLYRAVLRISSMLHVRYRLTRFCCPRAQHEVLEGRAAG